MLQTEAQKERLHYYIDNKGGVNEKYVVGCGGKYAGGHEIMQLDVRVSPPAF